MNDMSGLRAGSTHRAIKAHDDDGITLSALWLARVQHIQDMAEEKGLTMTFGGPENSMQIRRISPHGKVNKVVLGSVSVETVSMAYD